MSSNDNRDSEYFNEGILQAFIAAQGALEKDETQRDQRDILLIENLCSLLSGFEGFPETVRLALAAKAVLVVVNGIGQELIIHNEELDSFNVLIYGECALLNPVRTTVIRNLRVGDKFGHTRSTCETVRFVGHIISNCDCCAFICIYKDDFIRIINDPDNYSR